MEINVKRMEKCQLASKVLICLFVFITTILDFAMLTHASEIFRQDTTLGLSLILTIISHTALVILVIMTKSSETEIKVFNVCCSCCSRHKEPSNTTSPTTKEEPSASDAKKQITSGNEHSNSEYSRYSYENSII
ncbi:MAG: hypothetical protein MHMPM18_001982 [Marteilia pararefringens]